jgi:hypothetical protein
MWPALRAGDHAGFALASGPPSPGEVVIARTGSGLVIHRVVRIDGAQAILKGDACRTADAPIPLAAVLGVVYRVRRGARQLDRRGWDGPVARLGRALAPWLLSIRRARARGGAAA